MMSILPDANRIDHKPLQVQSSMPYEVESPLLLSAVAEKADNVQIIGSNLPQYATDEPRRDGRASAVLHPHHRRTDVPCDGATQRAHEGVM